MLSQENIDKLCMTGLYKREPNEYDKIRFKDNLYHCKNWTFTIQEWHSKYKMMDTYYGNTFGIVLDDDNFDEFKLIFDYNDVVREDYHPEYYNEEDVFRVAIDSGGVYRAKHFRKKDAKPSQERLEMIWNQDIRKLKSRLENLERELEEIENGTYYLLE